MSEAKKRKFHTPEFKAKVGLEALRGVKTINELGQEFGVHPITVGKWKKEIQEQAKTLFESKRGPKPIAAHREPVNEFDMANYNRNTNCRTIMSSLVNWLRKMRLHHHK